MTGFIKIIAEENGNLQRVSSEVELRHVSEEDKAMLIGAAFEGLNVGIRNRRAVRKLLRMARNIKTTEE